MKRIYLSLLTCILFIPIASATAITPPSVKPVTLMATETDSEKIRQIAQQITVKIVVGNTASSGVIIAKNGQTYTVITNAHVITRSKTYRIQTPDGNSYDATLKVQGSSLEGNDLALLEFTSPNTYSVATLGDGGTLKKDETVYSAGFPFDDNKLTFSSGNITLMAEKPLKGGYQIGYTNATDAGMSGGALLNAEGKLIGIVGMGKGAVLENAYSYQDGTTPNRETVQQLRSSSFAVPIQTLISVVPDSDIIPPQWKAGLNIAEKVDRIAQQITVRIDAADGSNGSGVIIGKKGTTYYVATACHVVVPGICKQENIQNTSFTLVTPDGEKYSIGRENIFTSEGIDAAIIQFTSEKSYQVATIAKYDTNFLDNQWIFLSGFPAQLKGTRKFTAGFRFNRQTGLAKAKDYQNLFIDITGYELIFSNLTQRGMSGGAILDTSGQLIGINGGEEGGEEATLTNSGQESKKVDIYLGYALGVPSSSLIALATKKNIPQDGLTITTTRVPSLTPTELTTLKLHSSFVVEKPSSNADAGEWLNYETQLWRLERYEEAISAIQQAIKLKPDFYQAYYALGLVYDSQKKNTEALNAYEKTIALQPNYYEAWYKKSGILNIFKKNEEALAAIDKAIALRGKDDFRLYILRGFYLFSLGRFSEADQAYTRSIEIYPHSLAYLLQCYVNALASLYEKAIVACNHALELDSNETVYYFRGTLRFDRGDYQGAIEDLNKAIEFKSDFPNFYFFRAGINMRIGDKQGASADFNKVLELEPTADNYYNIANARSVIEDYQGALRDINKAIELAPQAKYYEQRGNIRSALNDKQGAIADYNQALALMPDFGNAYSGRAGIRINLSDYEGAESDYTMALNLYTQKPESWWGDTPENSRLNDPTQKNLVIRSFNIAIAGVYNLRGLTRHQLKKYPQAIEDLSEAIKLTPDNALIYITRGDYYTDLNQPENAKLDYQKAVSLYSQEISTNPNSAEAFENRAEVRKKLQDYQGAIEDISKAIELNPNEANYYGTRGDYRQDIKDYQGAVEDYTQAIKLNPDEPVYYRVRGYWKAELKDYQGAIEDFSQAIKLNPNEASYYALRGYSRAAIKDYQGAIEDYLQALKLNPNEQDYLSSLMSVLNQCIETDPKNGLCYYVRGTIYSGSQDYQEAATQDLSKAIEYQENPVDAYLSRAEILREQKDYQGAIADLNKVIEMTPDAPEPYFTRGIIYHVQGDYQSALSDYNLALSKDKNFIAAINNIGLINYEQGNITTALQQWQKSYELDNNFAETQFALAVVFYGQGEKEKALQLAQKALTIDKNFAQIDYLKQNLWGEKLISDAQKLLSEPSLQKLISN